MRLRVLVTSLAALALASAALSGQTIRRDSPTVTGPGPAGTAVISGTILTDESTPQPMRRARVALTSVLDGAAGGVANVAGGGGGRGGGGAGGGGGLGGRSIVTDDAGRFTFERLPAGRYSLVASKPGYLRLSYGAKRQDGAGTVITLGDGQQMAGLTIRLPRGSVIAGRIIDATGEPAFGVSVRAMRSRMQGSDRTFTPVALANSEQTDDRGMYRLYGLPPGEYVLVATPRDAGNADIRAMTDAEIRAALAELQQPPAAAGRTGATALAPTQPPIEPTMVGFAPVYYPGTTNAAMATTIALGAGEERSGVDLQLQNVRTAKIEGTIVTPAGVSPQSVQLSLLPSGAATMMGGPTLLNRTAIQPDGKFSYTGITPGQYSITARSGGGRQVMMVGGGDLMTMSGTMAAMAGQAGPGRAGGEGASANAPPAPVLWGQANLSVEGQNIDGVVITLQPGMTMTGRIAFDAAKAAPPTDLSRARIQLLPEPTANMVTMSTAVAEVDATGKFTVTGVTPGKYRFTATVPPAPGTLGQWILKSATVGSQDALDGTLYIAPNDTPGEAVLTFTDQTQDVSGMLQDASGGAAPDYTIVVFAADRKYWTATSRRIRTARPSTDGRFTVTGLPAGEYRLAALTDIVPGDQNDPAFLEQLVAASIAFTLAPGEKHVQDLRVGK